MRRAGFLLVLDHARTYGGERLGVAPGARFRLGARIYGASARARVVQMSTVLMPELEKAREGRA